MNHVTDTWLDQRDGYHSSSAGAVYPASSPVRRVADDDDDDELTHWRDTSASFWPPWPFNLLVNHDQDDGADDEENARRRGLDPNASQSAIGAARRYTRQTASAAVRNAQAIGSHLWFHLPPAMPPFLLVASVPRRISDDAGVRYVMPVWSNRFCRNVAWAGLGLAIMSWAHSEVHRQRRQTPLPLADGLRDTNRAILPPFLPEAAAAEDSYLQSLLSYDGPSDDDKVKIEDKVRKRRGDSVSYNGFLRGQWAQFQRSPLTPQALATRRDGRQVKQRERQNARRLTTYDELMLLQKYRRKRAKKVHQRRNKESQDIAPLGYALVTGASRGIGRAIAVELARWEIPLILVARDAERLMALATDIEICYGVKCVVLPADLSELGAADRIYQTTTKHNLSVDILVNNAGLPSQGLAVDMPLSEVRHILQVNAMAVSDLAHLYGRDMKERRRGRILMMSSICGSVAGLPSVASYAATKSFDTTLGLSLSKELEPYGVGVTCVMPGAVRDTEFRVRGGSPEALCWKIPSYAKTPPQVASWSVRAMLRGDTECTPGWQNRAFLKMLKPALPPRLHNLIAEAAWSPVNWPSTKQNKWQDRMQDIDSAAVNERPPPPIAVRPKLGWRVSSPKQLRLEGTASVRNVGNDKTRSGGISESEVPTAESAPSSIGGGSRPDELESHYHVEDLRRAVEELRHATDELHAASSNATSPEVPTGEDTNHDESLMETAEAPEENNSEEQDVSRLGGEPDSSQHSILEKLSW